MKKILLVLGGIVVFVLSSFVVNAESIKQFDVDVQLNKDGSVKVLEKILYDFDRQERHGIFRDVPNLYGEEGIRMNVDFLSVTDEVGEPYRFSEEDGSGYKSIRIGDPDRTVSGIHWYYITYSMDGVINGFDDHDEFYWNVTGNTWQVPIESSEITVTVPKGDGSEIGKVACYNGYLGESYSDCGGSFNGRVASYQMNQALYSGQQWTVVASLDKGLVTTAGFLIVNTDPAYSKITVDREDYMLDGYLARLSEGKHRISVENGIRYDEYNQEIDIVSGETVSLDVVLERNLIGYFLEDVFPILLIVLSLYLIIMLWVKKGRDPKGKGVIMPFYKPPENISPGEAGVLIDEKAHMHDITATMIQLAVKGYMNIKKEEKKAFLWGKETDYTFVKNKKSDSEVASTSLLDFEKEVFDAIFNKSDSDKVTLKDLQKRFYKDLPKIKKSFYGHVVDQGYFPQDPDKVRAKYVIVAIIILSFIFPLSGFLVNYFNSGFYLGLVPVGFVAFVLSLYMAKKTVKGVEMYEKVKGHKMFIETAEKDRLETLFSPKEYNDVFEKNLPYAIAYGVEEKWAKEFEDLCKSVPVWYTGDATFHGFTRSFGDFTRTSVKALTVNPNGSRAGGGWSGGSGFSGGGFSGGGFGGGGGGSW